MEIQTIDITQNKQTKHDARPSNWKDFIGQKPLVKIIKTALQSAKTSGASLWHTLLTWPSWHGKTTLARLIANDMGVRVHHITAYALNKPAEIISLLNSLQKNDILFIDELHRLKPIIEEVLYVAMEDFSIDMLMPDGKPLRLTLHPFTLIGATTKPEALSTPLKNRFVYKLHFQEYSNEEKEEILTFHCNRLAIILEDTQLSQRICSYVTAVPREIGNLSTQLHDWLIAHYGMHDRLVSYIRREQFRQDLQLQQWGLTALHQQYMDILEHSDGRALWLKTIAVSLWMNEKAIEEDIEPLLLKLGKIEKTSKGRILV